MDSIILGLGLIALGGYLAFGAYMKFFMGRGL